MKIKVKDRKKSSRESFFLTIDRLGFIKSLDFWKTGLFFLDFAPRYLYVYTYIWQRRQWHPTPVLLPGKSHGQRSLEGPHPWGRWVPQTERLHFHFSLSRIGEGNGNPLQCSCLENPREEGAWWAAVYGDAQNQTWLKWLSSSTYVRISVYIVYMLVLQKPTFCGVCCRGG